jgi:hypothetical protein
MERITEQPDMLENVITCDETWIFQYDPETKIIDALEDTHFIENEKSKNKQVESESNDDCFLRCQRRNHD